MAVNENIKNGVYRVWNSLESAWDRYAFWTKANRVEFNDGKDAETKLGKINGITDSTTSTASDLAASAKAVNLLKTEISNVKTSFQDGCSVIANAITERGVTTANNASPDVMAENIMKISSGTSFLYYLGTASFSGTMLTTSRHFSFNYSHLPNYESLTLDDFIVGISGSDRITMATNDATGYVGMELRSGGELRVKWWGNSEQSDCSVNVHVYALSQMSGVVRNKTYTVTLTGGSQSLHHSGEIDISSLGTIVSYGVTGMNFGYNCYFNQVDNFSTSCKLTGDKIIVSLNVSANTDPYAANYITGDCKATIVVYYI